MLAVRSQFNCESKADPPPPPPPRVKVALQEKKINIEKLDSYRLSF